MEWQLKSPEMHCTHGCLTIPSHQQRTEHLVIAINGERYEIAINGERYEIAINGERHAIAINGKRHEIARICVQNGQ